MENGSLGIFMVNSTKFILSGIINQMQHAHAASVGDKVIRSDMA